MFARLITFSILLIGFTSVASAATMIGPADLQEARESGKIELLIDIRNSQKFENGHIPGAINIPVFALKTRMIPAKGKVAIYSDGLGKIDEQEAIKTIQESHSIELLLLSGGLAAWESAGLPTTHKKGLSPSETPIITYQDLKKMQANGIVLADLRTTALKRTAADNRPAPASALSNLNDVFPQARIVEPKNSRTAHASDSQSESSGSSELFQNLSTISPTDELIVLIDNGDGDRSAEETLRRLRAGGNRRVVILAGGETIIQREGRSGLSRAGYTIGETYDENSNP